MVDPRWTGDCVSPERAEVYELRRKLEETRAAIRTQRAKNEWLRTQKAELDVTEKMLSADIEELVAERNIKDAHIAELEAALRPFARMATGFGESIGDELEVRCFPLHGDFDVGDLRRAAAALEEKP